MSPQFLKGARISWSFGEEEIASNTPRTRMRPCSASVDCALQFETVWRLELIRPQIYNEHLSYINVSVSAMHKEEIVIER